MSARVRIGTVTLKGGAKLKMFRNVVSDRVAAKLLRNANEIIRREDDQLAGFALVVWDKRGRCSTAALCDGVGVSANHLPEFAKTAFQDYRTRVNCEYDILGKTREDEPA